MSKLEKIKIGTNETAFDWLLTSDDNACWPEGNSKMIRHLVHKYNQMIDRISELEKILNEEAQRERTEEVCRCNGSGTFYDSELDRSFICPCKAKQTD